jgi:NAD+ diphosphatase
MPLDFFVNTFAGGVLDRRSDQRLDADWLTSLRSSPATQVVALWNGQPLLRDHGDGLALVQLEAEVGLRLAGSDEHVLFLGLDERKRAVFAVDLLGDADPSAGPLEGRGRFLDLRMSGGRMSPSDAGAAATAKAVFEWKRRHGFCSACGQPSAASEGGWKRTCPACGAEHFPRTDPVTIMLPAYRDQALLGRQATWPKGRFSCLAGFMEPGESIEAACAREVKEEAGLTVVSVRYHSSQPWPFPSNLMIGLIAEVSDQQATPDQTELEEVRWFGRQELRALLAGEVEGLGVPPPFAIAHQLMKAWSEG